MSTSLSIHPYAACPSTIHPPLFALPCSTSRSSPPSLIFSVEFHICAIIFLFDTLWGLSSYLCVVWLLRSAPQYVNLSTPNPLPRPSPFHSSMVSMHSDLRALTRRGNTRSR